MLKWGGRGFTSTWTSNRPGQVRTPGIPLPRRSEVPEDRATGLDVLPQCDVDASVVEDTLPQLGEIQTAPVIRVVKRAGHQPT
jgi:hypothetical protein